MGLLAGWLASLNAPWECEGAWRYSVGVGGLLGAFTLCLCLEAALVVVGLRGSVFEVSKRRAVPGLLYCLAACYLACVAFNGECCVLCALRRTAGPPAGPRCPSPCRWHPPRQPLTSYALHPGLPPNLTPPGYCTHLMYSDPPECEGEGGGWDPLSVMWGLVWSTWAVLSALLLLLVFSYNLFPDYHDPAAWERRCACVFTLCCACCDRRGRGGDEEDIAARLGRIFAMVRGEEGWLRGRRVGLGRLQGCLGRRRGCAPQPAPPLLQLTD